MIIDKILDRKDDDKLIAEGYTHIINGITGKPIKLGYNADQFYKDVVAYGAIGTEIIRAMRTGSETDVKAALCKYIIDNEYNPDICGYVWSRNWLTNDK